MSDQYPHLSEAQEAALDRDGDGKPGGRKKKAAPAPVAAELSQDEIIKRAVEQSRKNVEPPKPPEFVTVRVLKKGDGRISTGHHVAGFGDAFYRYNETFSTTTENAAELEERGFAEIVEA